MARSTHWEGESTSVWEERWRVARVEAHDVLGSTNERARDLAEEGAPLPSVVIAEEQTAGRGRNGSAWHSPAGAGLWISVALALESDGLRTLPLRVGLAAARACEEGAPGLHVGIKWPNDLEVAGQKIGGILCERVPGVVIVGVGLNLRRPQGGFPPELIGRATSLEAEAGRPVPRAGVAGALLAGVHAVAATPAEMLDEDSMADLAERDVLTGRRVRTQQRGEGTARGIARDGALLVETPSGRMVSVVAGSVRTL